jgi:hypothetical protein
MNLSLTLQDGAGARPLDIEVSELVIAGWTARNVEAMEAHIAELEAIGVTRPKRTPTYYRNARSLLTTDEEIEVVGDGSSGEVEFVLLMLEDGPHIGLGSDHTDREVEKTGVTISKQLCPKPICNDVWKYADVADHWDRLVLRSFAVTGGERTLYQEGPVTTMRAPLDLLDDYLQGRTVPAGLVMYCGTLAVHGAVRAAERFEIELEDPVLGRRLEHVYGARQLPIEG